MWFDGIHLNISFVHFALFKKKHQIYLQTSALNWFLTFLTLSLGFQTPGPVARSGPRTLSLLARDEMSKISLNLRYVFLFNYWKALIIPLRIKNRIFTVLFHRRISPVYDVIDLQRSGVTWITSSCPWPTSTDFWWIYQYWTSHPDVARRWNDSGSRGPQLICVWDPGISTERHTNPGWGERGGEGLLVQDLLTFMKYSVYNGGCISIHSCLWFMCVNIKAAQVH